MERRGEESWPALPLQGLSRGPKPGGLRARGPRERLVPTRRSGAAWGLMNAYPDYVPQCLYAGCYVKSFEGSDSEGIEEERGLEFAIVAPSTAGREQGASMSLQLANVAMKCVTRKGSTLFERTRGER